MDTIAVKKIFNESLTDKSKTGNKIRVKHRLRSGDQQTEYTRQRQVMKTRKRVRVKTRIADHRK